MGREREGGGEKERCVLFIRSPSLSAGPRHSSRVRLHPRTSATPGRRFQLDDASRRRRSRATKDEGEGLFGTTPFLPMESFVRAFVRSLVRSFVGRTECTRKPRSRKQEHPRGFAKVAYRGQDRMQVRDACFGVKFGCPMFNPTHIMSPYVVFK